MDEKDLEQIRGAVDKAANRNLIATALISIIVLVTVALIIVL